MRKTCKWSKVGMGWQAFNRNGHCVIHPSKGRGYWDLSCYIGPELRGAKHYSSSAKSAAVLKRSGCKKLQ